jgi:hypothetical protein
MLGIILVFFKELFNPVVNDIGVPQQSRQCCNLAQLLGFLIKLFMQLI